MVCNTIYSAYPLELHMPAVCPSLHTGDHHQSRSQQDEGCKDEIEASHPKHRTAGPVRPTVCSAVLVDMAVLRASNLH